MKDFKIDEEIEIADFEDFSDKIVVKFKHRNLGSAGWVGGEDKRGILKIRAYARRINPKVTVWIKNESGFINVYEDAISKELADKIRNGEDL
jgi:hypothetical protein